MHRATANTGAPPRSEDFDVIVIGAGFGGMYALYHLRQSGLSVRAFEEGSGVGGTWYWNRYPGSRVDVESMVYSYSFSEELQQEWHWPEQFSPQSELERYANHVADRFDLRKDIQFKTRVSALTFDDDTNVWVVKAGGRSYTSTFLVAATGGLNAKHIPDFQGLAEFRGTWYHTADWPKEQVNFEGKRVGIVGTGSSGIQAVPVVAQTAEELFVFQRTANFSVPCLNRQMDPEYEREWKDNYAARRKMLMSTESAMTLRGVVDRSVLDVTDEEREAILEEAWNAGGGLKFLATFKDIRTNLDANNHVSDFVRRKIRAIVKDPEVAELLCPKTHPIGTKRLCADTGYYETFNRDNVTLVDVKSAPIVEITPSGLRTTKGHYDLDMIIFATGFDAMTGNLIRIDITGKAGRKLADEWRGGPRSYLGLGVEGFPNLFLVHGPGSPSVLAPMIMGAEWQINWIADAIDFLHKNGYDRIESTSEAEEAWGAEVQAAVDRSLYKLAKDAWYGGANIPGKAQVFSVFVGGFDVYAARCSEVAEDNYQGFELSSAASRRTTVGPSVHSG